jgi:hypothetical protein
MGYIVFHARVGHKEAYPNGIGVLTLEYNLR